MLPAQLSRLLLRQTHRAATRQHVCQVASAALPESLLPCLQRVCRAKCAVTAATSVIPSPSVVCLHLHLCRGFSTSTSTHTTKKTTTTTTAATNKKKTNTASERREICQVLDNSELLVGRMTVAEAENMARKEGLKLIDLGSNSDGLRSLRLVSGRELAEESKRQRLEKKGERERGREKEKEVRLTSNITDHDLEVKMRQVKDTLGRGGQVKVVIRAHRRVEQSVGERQVSQLLRKVTADIADLALVKQATRSQGEQQLHLRPKPPSSPEEE